MLCCGKWTRRFGPVFATVQRLSTGALPFAHILHGFFEQRALPREIFFTCNFSFFFSLETRVSMLCIFFDTFNFKSIG